MTTRIIVGIVALECGSICVMTASFTNLEMMDKVNEKLPKEEQFARLGGIYPSTNDSVANIKGCIQMGAFS
jgi:hypothetical protein